jgi:orotidine-5'-phosphate decarboxylase
LRAAHPQLPFLVPGIGAQGGNLQATLAAGLDAHGAGLLISASRSIIYAGGGTAASIRAAAEELHAAINYERAKSRPLERAKTRAI